MIRVTFTFTWNMRSEAAGGGEKNEKHKGERFFTDLTKFDLLPSLGTRAVCSGKMSDACSRLLVIIILLKVHYVHAHRIIAVCHYR